MTIPNNWYISDCTSEVYPTSKMDAGTFYLPNNIQYNEEDKIYYYQEYRFTMPIDYEVPAEVSDTLAEQLDIYSKQFGKRIYELEGTQVEVGVLDVTAYRDDKRQDQPAQDRTCLPFSVEGKQIILVDDVIYTGRTVRAAMDAILQRGRARSIQLAALIDRGHRELPIRADYVGKNLPTSRDEFVKVMVAEHDGEDQVVICEERVQESI